MTATSPYLHRPLRSLEEARRDLDRRLRRALCARCKGSGRVIQWRGYAEMSLPCPACSDDCEAVRQALAGQSGKQAKERDDAE